MIGELTGLLAVLFIFGPPAIWLFSKTPIAQALIHRITLGADSPHLLAELDEVRARLAEVEDRLEFAERQLTQGAARPLPSKPEA